MARPTELTVTYARKNKTGDYESEEVFLASKVELESGDDIPTVIDEIFDTLTAEVDKWSAKGARVLVREAHGNVAPPVDLSKAVPPPKQPAPPPQQPAPQPAPASPAPAKGELDRWNYDSMDPISDGQKKRYLWLRDVIAKKKTQAVVDKFVEKEYKDKFNRDLPEHIHDLGKGPISYLMDRLEATFPDAVPPPKPKV